MADNALALAWKHCVVNLASGAHHVLVFDMAALTKHHRQDLLRHLQVDWMPDHGAQKKGIPSWHHPTRVPWALLTRDEAPFEIEDRDITMAMHNSELTGLLLLDKESGAVWYVDMPDGYFPEKPAAPVQIAPSVGALKIREGKALD